MQVGMLLHGGPDDRWPKREWDEKAAGETKRNSDVVMGDGGEEEECKQIPDSTCSQLSSNI